MKKRYRLFESLPGILSWGFISLAVLVVYLDPIIFIGLMFAFTLYWVISCFRIVILASFGTRKIKAVASTDWNSRLRIEFPESQDYYYCSILPYASESINILRQTVQSIAETKFPANRKILCLSSEKALPAGRFVAEQIRSEFAEHFAFIFVTEHELAQGELKGKASNQNHCGRYLYGKIKTLGIEPAKVLFSSNDADVLNDLNYPSYLLYTYLSSGKDRDCYIYQPIPTDYHNFWSARFFSRIIISTGVLWRTALQMRADYRCTVYSFYSMTLETLHNIGYWDTDLIPEDERTMFKAILAFGERFKVVPLFILTRGSPVCGKDAMQAFKEQYIQIRRWAWGASEFAHSMTQYLNAPEDRKRALFAPIFNQLRTSTEWSLSALFLMFAGYLPGLFHPEFRHSTIGHMYPVILSGVMSLASLLIIAIIVLDSKLAPPRPTHRGPWFSAMTYGQWILAPLIGIILSSAPALESQTRLIFNRRIAYVESRKEHELTQVIQVHESPAADRLIR